MIPSIPNSKNKVKQTEQQIQNYLTLLKKIPFFSKCENNELLTDIISEAIKSNNIKFHAPHGLVWHSKVPLKPNTFSVVLEGLLTVHYEEARSITNNKNNHIYNFIQEGGILGEFEFANIQTRAKEIYSLSESIILTLSPKDVEKLKKEKPNEFNNYFLSCLTSKLYSKNFIIEILLRKRVTERMIFLLLHFMSDWSNFIKDDTQNSDSYLIDIYWSDNVICALLATEFKKVREALYELTENKFIKCYKFTKNKEGKLSPDRNNPEMTLDYLSAPKDGKSTKPVKSKCQKNKNNWMQIEVINYSKMIAYKSESKKED